MTKVHTLLKALQAKFQGTSDIFPHLGLALDGRLEIRIETKQKIHLFILTDDDNEKSVPELVSEIEQLINSWQASRERI